MPPNATRRSSPSPARVPAARGREALTTAFQASDNAMLTKLVRLLHAVLHPAMCSWSSSQSPHICRLACSAV
eukprot:365550-Chlamydomonas_euryale.AAC.4